MRDERRPLVTTRRQLLPGPTAPCSTRLMPPSARCCARCAPPTWPGPRHHWPCRLSSREPVAIASAPMPDRSRRFDPVLAVGIAIALALGLLLMHGLDARAVADGHGFTASPSAIISAAHEAPDTVDAMGDQVTTAAGAASASMLGQCIAVLAAGGLLLLLRLAHRATAGSPRKTRSQGSDDVCAHGWLQRRVRRPPPLPRVALCVSLC